MKGALPARLAFRPEGPRVEWVFTHGTPFTEPFFDETLRRLRCLPMNRRHLRPDTPVSALADVAPGLPLAGLIFHVSRCGSTLLAQMLAAVERHVVVSEAPVLDDILQSARRDPRITDPDRIAWLRGAVASLGQRKRAGEERLFVKLDCWDIFELPLIARAFPGVPLLFVHRHPVDVLVSLLRKPSLTLLPETVPAARLGLTEAERNALAWEARAAAILGAFFRAARTHRAALTPVAYEQLPRFAWEAMPGCAFTAEEQETLRAAASRDAKNPAEAFQPDAAEKRRSASPAVLAAAEAHALADYEAFLATCGEPVGNTAAGA